MKVIRTAKLKLAHDVHEREQLMTVCLTFREAQNHVSRWVFDAGKKTSIPVTHRGCYDTLRQTLPSQLACTVIRQVIGVYKGLWTKTKETAERLKTAQGMKVAGTWKGRLPRPYRGLETVPVFRKPTLEYQYGKDFTFKKDSRVSLLTLSGRLVLNYEGWKKHLEDLQHPETEIGAAKLWYDKPKKQWYLLVSYTVEVPESVQTSIVGVDVGQRYHAVCQQVDLTQVHPAVFFEGRSHQRVADRCQNVRSQLQVKGTRSAKKRLVSLSRRERRFTTCRNHTLSKQILSQYPHALIGMEDLSHIRERTEPRKNQQASLKQKRANRVRSTWSFAELRNFVTYKAPFVGSQVVEIDPKYTSQTCPKCGYISRDNRKNGGEVFCCMTCGYTEHADTVGAINVGMKVREKRIAGHLSTVPDVSAGDSETRLAWIEDEARDKPVTSVMGG